jgi:predicted glycosyltransferase
LAKQRKIDFVLSDNRYGLKIQGVPSVIMTHQLMIKSGKGAFVDQLLQKFHYQILATFDECWVVDQPGPDNLSGELAHPRLLPRNAHYIGWLSQLPKLEADSTRDGAVLILLSGPEPTRTMLEGLLLEQCKSLHQYRFIFVAGNTAGEVPQDLPAHISYHPYVHSDQLSHFLQSAELVVCRSGYSTLMDLAVSGKKALLIPTPGQPEQEYLGKSLQERGFFFCQSQSVLNLSRDLPVALTYPGFTSTDGDGTGVAPLLREAVRRCIPAD